MPRKPRYILPHIPIHIVQRGLSRAPIFFEDDDYQMFLEYLVNSKDKCDCKVHAYVLMENHYHLLVTPPDSQSLSKMMQGIGRYFVPYINHKYGRSGTLWEGRFKANMVQDESYFLACMRYIEMNPVAAKMVAGPADYTWSSYQHNAHGGAPNWLCLHQEYLDLGHSAAGRQQAYRQLFDGVLDKKTRTSLGNALQSGTPLGNDCFKLQVEKALGCKVGYDRRGRPWPKAKK